MMKLKNKLQIYKEYISYYISQNIFKELYIFSIIISIYAALLSRINGDVIDGIFNVFCFSTFLLCFFLIIIVNIISFNQFLDNISDFWGIRIGNKYDILKEKIKMTLIINLYFNILFILLIISLIFMVHSGYINNGIYKTYKITKVTFLIYFILRMILFNSVLTTYNVILYEKIGLKTIIFDMLFLVGLFIFSIQNDLKITLNLYNILNLSHFKNFTYDIVSSFINICLLTIISFIIAKTFHRRKVK